MEFSEPPLTPIDARPRWRMPVMQEAGLLGVIIIVALILSVFGYYRAPAGRINSFLELDNLIGGMAVPMSYFAIMALGATLVIITGGIDISVGSIFTAACLGTAGLLQYVPRDAAGWWVVPLAFVLAGGIGMVFGLVNGALIVFLRLHPFIVTLGTMSVIRGIAVVSPPQTTLPLPGRQVPDAFTAGFVRWEIHGLRPVPMLIMLACVGLAWFYLRMTVGGREIYAVGGNEEAARFSGIRVGRVKMRVYALSGLAAGVAALVYLGRFGTASTQLARAGYELTVIAAAAVGGASLSGGRGSALGALLGTLIIRLLENGIDIVGLNQDYSQIVIGSAIIVAVSIDQLSQVLRRRPHPAS
jgi:ribose/xylose/arabinose/galactoside ABC-type transport system permease subunit